LNTAPAEAGFSANAEFPHVFGALIDWPIGQVTASILSVRDGTASLYTTSTFGIIGGGGHAAVRDAAIQFVRVAESLFEKSQPTKDCPYPPGNGVRFYLMCYDGIRYIESDLHSLTAGNPYSVVWAAGQDVLTQLRLIHQEKPGV
jgi:hypothetical protein